MIYFTYLFFDRGTSGRWNPKSEGRRFGVGGYRCGSVLGSLAGDPLAPIATTNRAIANERLPRVEGETNYSDSWLLPWHGLLTHIFINSAAPTAFEYGRVRCFGLCNLFTDHLCHLLACLLPSRVPRHFQVASTGRLTSGLSVLFRIRTPSCSHERSFSWIGSSCQRYI
jgi:hypothetical protein